MDKKTIKALPLPKASADIKTLALQGDGKNTVVLSVQKVQGMICINAFTADNKKVVLTHRWFFSSAFKLGYSETFLYNLSKGKITNGYLTNALNNFFDSYRVNITASDKETEKLIRYTDIKCQSVWGVLTFIEDAISSSRKKHRIEKKENEVDALMKCIRKVPESFEKTIEKTMAFSSYVFFDREEDKGTCSNCGSSFSLKEIPKFRQREKGHCPACKKEVTFLSDKNRKRMRPDLGTAVLLQAAGKRVLVERYFNINYDYTKSTDGKPIPHVREVIRTFVNYDTHTISDYEYYYFHNKLRWCPPQKSMFCPDGLHHMIYKGHLHKAGLNAEYKKADLTTRFDGKERIEKKMYSNPERENVYCHLKYYESVAKLPIIEQLAKVHLDKLCVSLLKSPHSSYYSKIDFKQTSLIKALNLKNRRQLREAIDMDISYDELACVQIHNEVSKKDRPIKDIVNLSHIFKGREKEAFQYSDSLLRKFSIYFAEREEYKGRLNNNICADYFDYLNFCRELDYDMNSEIVLFPRDFKKAHDEAATEVKAKNMSAHYEKLDKLLPELHKKYDFCDEESGYFIKVPEHGKEITYEGQALNHCVGGYVSRMAQGDCVILFLRPINKPDKPYCTVEVRNGRVVQARIFNNGNPPEKVWNFINDFKAQKLTA